ncbi:MAG: hypothetical protein L6R40_000782 [Gallowayella cf. fulva]|nr:MAG: hypothetical protein L6R40_000782 [Xanthomendoza cf. fulva]
MTDQVRPASGIPRLSRLPARSSIPQRPETSTSDRPIPVNTEPDLLRIQRSRPRPAPLKAIENQAQQTKVFVKPTTIRTPAAPNSKRDAKVQRGAESEVDRAENPVPDHGAAKSATRRPRPSLSDRVIQTLSHIPPSPSPRRRQSGFFPIDSPAIRPPSSLGKNRPITSTGFYPPLPSSRPTSPSKRPGLIPNARPTGSIVRSEQISRPASKAKTKPSLQKPSLQKPSLTETPKSILKSSAALRETIANAKAARRAVPKYDGDEVAKPMTVNRSVDLPKTDMKEEGHINPLRRRITAARGHGYLNISGLGLEIFPKEVLHMYDPDSATDGPTWYESVDLTRLNAADNELEDLGWHNSDSTPTDDDELPRTSIFSCLQTIDVHGNRLQCLPPLLTQLKHLTILNVSRNQLKDPLREIAAIIAFIGPLRELSLAENQFTGPFPSLHRCRNLEVLDIHSNAFTSLPEDWLECSKMRRLDASKNKIRSIPRLDLPNLTSLNLSANPFAIDELMTNLAAPMLTTLDISNCRIDKLPPLRSKFPSLTTVIASDNRICTLDVESVRGLEVLDLKGNDLRSLPAELSLLGLKKLLVGGNPMRAPRREILEGTTQQLMEWLKGRLPAGVNDDETF